MFLKTDEKNHKTLFLFNSLVIIHCITKYFSCGFEKHLPNQPGRTTRTILIGSDFKVKTQLPVRTIDIKFIQHNLPYL